MRVYKSYDPRARSSRRIADLVFAVRQNPLLKSPSNSNGIALQDD